MIERERRYLVRERPQPRHPGTPIRQGYLSIARDQSVRVRDSAGRHTLTIKAGTGLERTEVELALPPGAFDALWPLTEGRRIEKTRYPIELPDGSLAELDAFEGPLAGLHLVEVEFATQESAHSFLPPPWFGPEVTDDGRYTNASLAVHGRPTAR